MTLMPCSTAARIVAMDCVSSVPPHIQPPMAQVPRATRDTSSDVPGTAERSMSISEISARRAMILLLRSSGLCGGPWKGAQPACSSGGLQLYVIDRQRADAFACCGEDRVADRRRDRRRPRLAHAAVP